MSHVRSASYRAFTLIELLVVISIIALLIAILMPALGQARTAALKIADASQMRGLGVAWMNYAQDNHYYLGAVSWADMNWKVADIANNTVSSSGAGDGQNWVEGTTAFMPWNMAITVGGYLNPGALASKADFGGTMTTNINYTPFPRFQMTFHNNYNYSLQVCNRYYGTSLPATAYTTGSIPNGYQYHQELKENFGGNSYYANMYLGSTPSGAAGAGMYRRATITNIEANGRPGSTMLAGFNGLGYHYWYFVPGYNTGVKQYMSWGAGGINAGGTFNSGLLPTNGDNIARSSNYLLADGHVTNISIPPNEYIKNLGPTATANYTSFYQWLSDRGVDVYANQPGSWPTGYLPSGPATTWDGRSGWTYTW